MNGVYEHVDVYTEDGKLIDVWKHTETGVEREKVLAEDGKLIDEWRDEYE